MKNKIVFLFLCSLPLAIKAKPLTEIEQIFKQQEAAQEKLPHDLRPESISLVDPEGFSFKVYPDLFQPPTPDISIAKNCFFTSPVLRAIYEDEAAFTGKQFPIPVSADELGKFFLFCGSGITEDSFAEAWEENLEEGYQTLEHLGFNFPGYQNRNLVFQLPDGQEVIIKGQLLYRLFKDRHRNSVLHVISQKKEKLFVQLPSYISLSFPEDELITTLKLSLLPLGQIKQKGIQLLRELIIKHKLSPQKALQVVEEIWQLANFLFVIKPTSSYSILLYTKNALDDLIGFGESNRDIRNQQDVLLFLMGDIQSLIELSDGTNPYRLSLNAFVRRNYFLNQLAPAFGYGAYTQTVNELIRKVKPTRQEYISDVDERMLFIKFGLLLKYVEIGYDEWFNKHLADLAAFILEWSRSLHKRYPATERKDFAQQIFSSFLKELQALGATAEEISSLIGNLRI